MPFLGGKEGHEVQEGQKINKNEKDWFLQITIMISEMQSPKGDTEKRKGEMKSAKGETEKMIGEMQSPKGEMEKRIGEMQSPKGETESEIVGAAEIVSV